MDKVGSRIKEERLKRKLTLEQVSQRTGLSKGFLSQIERGQVFPSISSLKKIAGQLGISVVYLFSDNEVAKEDYSRFTTQNEVKLASPPYSEDIRVVPAGRRKGLTLPGSTIHYDLLTPDLNRRLEVLFVRASPGESSGDEPMVNQPGEKFGMVLKGNLEMTVRDEVFHLGEGDTIYYPAHFPHSWRCVGDSPVELIWVMTPPSF